MSARGVVMVAGCCAAMGSSIVGPPARAQRISPAPLPAISTPGYQFPESEAAVTAWVAAITNAAADPTDAQAAFAALNGHAWGLWTAITALTSQTYENQPLHVFETWFTPQDLLAMPDATSTAQLRALARRPHSLRRFDQLKTSTVADSVNDRAVGYIKYNASAADHILSQGLLHQSTLQALLNGGAQGVPPFPADALAVKPIFQVAAPGSLVQGRYYELKVWEGPPATPQAFGPAQWPGAVWIDVLNGGSGSGSVDEAPQSDGSTRTDATTYPISNVISFRLSAADAAGLNLDKPGTGAAAGDYAFLVGMHVAGRETVRWTWQTFWWTPNADQPPGPSSAAIAAQRPASLTGAPRHYAMATAYAMEGPSQPVVGGSNTGSSLYAYNPWIEAAFAPADLPDSLAAADGAPNNVGVQSNCMSCHIRSSFNPGALATAPQFAGDRYTDLGDPAFVGTLQVDFLWSIPRNAE